MVEMAREFLMSILMMLGLIILLVLYWIYIPASVSSFVETTILRLTGLIFDSVRLLHAIVKLSVILAHFLGRICVILIFSISVVALSKDICNIFDYQLISQNNKLDQIIALLDNKVAWVAATAIVAATVALAHFRNFDLAIEKYEQEQTDRIEAKIQEKRKKALERQ